VHQGFLRYIELRRDDVPDWMVFPFSVPAVAKLDRIEFSPAVTFFVGENGSGKSTLVEAIASKAGFGAAGGTKNFSAAHRPSESPLHDFLRLVRGSRREKTGFFLRAETMYNVSTAAEDFASYGWDNLHEKSHGEGFLWVILNRFRSNGLYILDEPEAALSPQRQLALLGRLHQLVNDGSQFIISTHSPILMAFPDARILSLDSSGIHEVLYKETEHDCVTHAFLQNPERMLADIFAAVDEDE
jgi:predicted ATPase